MNIRSKYVFAVAVASIVGILAASFIGANQEAAVPPAAIKHAPQLPVQSDT